MRSNCGGASTPSSISIPKSRPHSSPTAFAFRANRPTVVGNTSTRSWDALKYGRPEIFSTDQGSQFTSADFTGLLLENKIAISMDGRGSWRDNVFVERLWRSVKYEEVCCGLTTASPNAPPPRSAGIWFSITRYVHIRALTRERRITPTSTTSRSGRQHEFRRQCRVVAPVGLRPPCAATRRWPLRNQPAGDPLIEGETLSRPSRPPLYAH